MGWGDAAGGRPRKFYERRRVDYPPPTPQRTPCRIWQGSVDRYGYGRVTVHIADEGRRSMTASRWIWTMGNGPIPPGMVVRHKCDNPPCFRLSHLELGTIADNNNDAATRGHTGRPISLSPSELERLRDERAAGRSYAAIYRDWAAKASGATYRTIASLGEKLERGWVPNPPPPPGYAPEPTKPKRKQNPAKQAKAARYAAWRENGAQDGPRPTVRPR